MVNTVKTGDVYRSTFSRGLYSVVRVTDDSYTYVTSTAVNTVKFGSQEPFPAPYFTKVYSL